MEPTKTLKAVEDLLAAQMGEWASAKANYDALNDVEVKEIALDGMNIKVQFNPARAVSSGAKVDAKSIAARKCFLCAENRPDVQRGIEWGGRYTILVNPFPIFSRHLTIPDKSHTLQLIEGRLADMVSLAADLPGYTVFYNGPKCGASAPDHMHFQAGNSDFLPIKENIDNADLQPLLVSDGAVLSVTQNLPANLFVIDTTDAQAAQDLFEKLLKAMPVPEGEKEPMMNILCYATEEGDARVIVIPRKRHRPSFYGTEGNECMMLSPASVDLGGVFITPRKVDFDKFDSEIAEKVFEELCLSDEEIDQIIEKL